MQKSFAVAAVLGALIIAVALLYHGRQLAEVSRRLQAMEQRTNGLDCRLEKFSHELPVLVEQAGNSAGRQAVHGMVEEVVQMPFHSLRPKVVGGATNIPKQVGSPSPSRGSTAEQGLPWIRFDIRDPVVNIDILPDLTVELLPHSKEAPAIARPPFDDRKPPASQTTPVGTTEPVGRMK